MVGDFGRDVIFYHCVVYWLQNFVVYFIVVYWNGFNVLTMKEQTPVGLGKDTNLYANKIALAPMVCLKIFVLIFGCGN